MTALTGYRLSLEDGQPKLVRGHSRSDYWSRDLNRERLGPEPTGDEILASLDAANADATVSSFLPAVLKRVAQEATLEALHGRINWERAADAFEAAASMVEEMEEKVEASRMLIQAMGRRRKVAGGLPEEKIDTPFGVLRIRAKPGPEKMVEIMSSSAASRMKRQGSLRDHGNWVDVQMDGVPRHYGLFHDINEQVGRGILRRAIQEYVDRRPSAFEEARLDALLRELSDVEVDLDKTSASEDELWLRLPDAYEKARHLREILAAVDHAAADDLPPVSMPNDPYER